MQDRIIKKNPVNAYESVAFFIYVGTSVPNQNTFTIKLRAHYIQGIVATIQFTTFTSLCKNINIKIYK